MHERDGMSRITNPLATEIPSYVLALILAIQSSAQRIGLEGWLPTTATGWITTLGFIGLIGKELWKRGQKEAVSEETINGIGLRITNTEQKYERLEGQFQEHQRTIDRVLHSTEQLIKELGKAERGTDQCREDTEKFTLEIGSKVDAMRREVIAELAATRKEFGERAGDLEVAVGVLTKEVQLRAEFDARDDRNQRG